MSYTKDSGMTKQLNETVDELRAKLTAAEQDLARVRASLNAADMAGRELGRQYHAAVQAKRAAEQAREAAEKDAQRYRARREHEWFEYDDYCISVMPRDGSATRSNYDQFIADYDSNSDSMLEDYGIAALAETMGTSDASTRKDEGQSRTVKSHPTDPPADAIALCETGIHLERQNAALLRDAERYRWLRDVNTHTHYGQNHIGGLTLGQKLLMTINGDPRLFECITIEVPLAHVPKDGEPIWCRSDDEAVDVEPTHFDFAANLDAAIDAALARQGERG